MTDDEKKYGVLEWNSSFSSMPVSGQGKIGNYALSQDFIDDIMLTKTWEDYDKAALSSAGYTYVPDNTYTQKHFIEPSNQTTRSHKEYDVRYYYSAADFETGQTVTAIGIQDGQTLKSALGITENLMKNKLDRDEAIKQGGTPGVGAQIFSVVSSLLLILGGFLLIIL